MTIFRLFHHFLLVALDVLPWQIAFRLVPAEFAFNPVVTLYRLAKVQNLVIWNSNDTFPNGIRDGVKTYAQYFGMNVTNFPVPNNLTAELARDLVSRIKAINPEAVVGATYASSCSVISAEFRRQNFVPTAVAQTDCISSPTTYSQYPDTKFFADKIEFDHRMTGPSWTDSKWYAPGSDFESSPQLAYDDMVETLNTTALQWSVAVTSAAGIVLTRGIEIAYSRLQNSISPCNPTAPIPMTSPVTTPVAPVPIPVPIIAPTTVPSSPIAAPVSSPVAAPVTTPAPVAVPVTPPTVPVTPPTVPVSVPTTTPISPPVTAPVSPPTPVAVPTSPPVSPPLTAPVPEPMSALPVEDPSSPEEPLSPIAAVVNELYGYSSSESITPSILRKHNAIYIDPYQSEKGQDRRLYQVMADIAKAGELNPALAEQRFLASNDFAERFRRDPKASRSIFEFVDTSQVVAALYLLNEASFIGQIGFSVWGQNNVKDTIVVQSDGTAENQIVYPLGSQTEGFVYPAPSFDERKPFTWRYFWRTVEIIFTPIIGVFILSSLVLMLLTFQNSQRKAIRAASPLFLQLILLGSIFLYASYFAWFTQPTTVMCHLRIWIVAIGFFLMFGALLAKTWRIMRIFTSKNLRVFQITDLNLLVVLTAGMTLLIVLLVLYSTVAKPFAIAKVGDALRPATTTQMQCTFENKTANFVILILLGVFFVFIVCFGAYLSARIWKVPKKQFNESRAIAFCMYNLLIFGVLTIALQASSALSTYPMFIARTVLITASTAFTIVALFAPKFPYLTCRCCCCALTDYELALETTTNGGTMTNGTMTNGTTNGKPNSRGAHHHSSSQGHSSSGSTRRRDIEGMPGRFKTVLIFLFPCLPCFTDEERYLVRFHRSSQGGRGNTTTTTTTNNTTNGNGDPSPTASRKGGRHAGGRYSAKYSSGGKGSATQHTPPPPLYTVSNSSTNDDNEAGDVSTPMKRIRHTTTTTTTTDDTTDTSSSTSSDSPSSSTAPLASAGATATAGASSAKSHPKTGKKSFHVAEYDHAAPVTEEALASLQWELERAARKSEKLKRKLKEQKKAYRLLEQQIQSNGGSNTASKGKSKKQPREDAEHHDEAVTLPPPLTATSSSTPRSDSIYSDSDSEDYKLNDDNDDASDSE